MKNLELFQKFTKTSVKAVTVDLKQAVVYTRVSTKEQSDKNLSLDVQKKTILEYAKRNNIEILSYFGGTYESAKTDGRKEFQRMLEFIRKNKGRVSHILVYALDRFSRTGGGAIKLAQDLRDKYGVAVFAVTQPTDTTNANGVFQQNIQFLFSEFDNQLRKQRVVAGMKEKFEKGVWCLRPPIGYDVVQVNSERKITVNKTGQQLKKAFKWKLEGVKSEEIVERLQALGVHIYKQKLSNVFANPFYCGIISSTLLNGKLIKGNHPAIVSEEDFLAVNNIRRTANKYGVPHRDEIEELPLKVFAQCEFCGIGYTGYIVKKKNIYYYKCRTKGCKCNKNAKAMNEQFEEFLADYAIHPDFIEPLYKIMGEKFEGLKSANEEQQKEIKTKLTEVQERIDSTEESYFIVKQMTEETYNKFIAKYRAEKAKFLEAMQDCGNYSSNLSDYYINALRFSMKLPTVWASSSVSVKEKIQNVIFPEGVYYNHKNGSFRTKRINEVFIDIARLAGLSRDEKTGQLMVNSELSSQVVQTGFEPILTESESGVLPLHY